MGTKDTKRVDYNALYERTCQELLIYQDVTITQYTMKDIRRRLKYAISEWLKTQEIPIYISKIVRSALDVSVLRLTPDKRHVELEYVSRNNFLELIPTEENSMRFTMRFEGTRDI